MTDHDTRTIERLRGAMAEATRGHHLPADAAARALDDAGEARQPVRTYLAIAACLLGVVALALVFTIRNNDDDANPAAPDCSLSTGLLPTWARGGFSSGALHTPHVLGADDRIAAIPFAQPLRVRPAKGSFNKILWVSKDGSFGPLRIEARLGDRRVTRTVDLGPSYLDLPAAGCWTLALTWPGHSDTVSLEYAP